MEIHLEVNNKTIKHTQKTKYIGHNYITYMAVRLFFFQKILFRSRYALHSTEPYGIKRKKQDLRQKQLTNRGGEDVSQITEIQIGRSKYSQKKLNSTSKTLNRLFNKYLFNT